MARSARPRHVGLAVDRALPERAEVEVLAQRDLALVVGHRADAVEAVRQAEVRPPGPGDEAQERRLLHRRRPPVDALKRPPPAGGAALQQPAGASGDHRSPAAPAIARARGRVASSHACTERLKAAGCSIIGACPQRGRKARRESGISAWNRSATSGGVMRSSRPHTTSVGAWIS